MGAAATLLEKITGEDLKSKAYLALDDLLNQDKEEGSILADGMMRGFANVLMNKAGLPVDISSRFAIGGAPGVSEFSGFDANNIFGPLGGLVKSVVTGIGSAAKDQSLIPLAKAVTPVGARKLIDLALNGDATDSNQNRMGLSEEEKVAYGLGFNPDRIRKLKEVERLVQTTTATRRRKQDKVEAEILELMKVSPEGAQAALLKYSHDLGVTPRDLARQVAQRATKAAFAKDIREDIPALDAETAMNLMRGMGLPPQPALQTQKAQFEAKLLAQLGIAPSRGSLMNAMRQDRMAETNPYLPFAGSSGPRSPASFPW
jgi:hypothetical protein